MEERKQKTNEGCPREDRLEAEAIEGAQTYMEITEGGLASILETPQRWTQELHLEREIQADAGTQGALKQAQKILDEGYEYAVGIDLERFFDTLNQSYLIELLSHTIKDGRGISLTHKYLFCWRDG